MQRPLWASTGAKNPEYSDVLYVDELIGPDTVNTLPDATLDAFVDHGTVARRVDADVAEAEAVWAALPGVGVDMDDVAAQLEREGVASFAQGVRRTHRDARSQGGRPAQLTRLSPDELVGVARASTGSYDTDQGPQIPRRISGSTVARRPGSMLNNSRSTKFCDESRRDLRAQGAQRPRIEVRHLARRTPGVLDDGDVANTCANLLGSIDEHLGVVGFGAETEAEACGDDEHRQRITRRRARAPPAAIVRVPALRKPPTPEGT